MTLNDGDFFCTSCLHWDDIDGCAAFPDGIPDEIFENEDKHSKPLPYQTNDFVYTPLDKPNE